MAKKTPTGTCKLCLKTAQLQESHIVSKFFWRGSGLFKTQKAFNTAAINNPAVKIPARQDGFKEYLLCGRCEQKRSKWERYCAPLFFHETSPTRHPPRYRYFEIDNIEYATLKLLILSTLWLMAVSSDIFYCHVHLNARKLEQLRKMLLAGNPGKDSRYGCVFTVLVGIDNFKPLPAFFSQPLKLKRTRNGITTTSYGCIIAGIHWEIFVSSVTDDASCKRFFPKESGRLTVMVASPYSFGYLKPLLDELKTRAG